MPKPPSFNDQRSSQYDGSQRNPDIEDRKLLNYHLSDYPTVAGDYNKLAEACREVSIVRREVENINCSYITSFCLNGLLWATIWRSLWAVPQR